MTHPEVNLGPDLTTFGHHICVHQITVQLPLMVLSVMHMK